MPDTERADGESPPLQGREDVNGELHYHYSDNGDGTTVVQRADYELGDSVIERIMKPVAKRYNERQFKNSLKSSKELIEAETTVPA